MSDDQQETRHGGPPTVVSLGERLNQQYNRHVRNMQAISGLGALSLVGEGPLLPLMAGGPPLTSK